MFLLDKYNIITSIDDITFHKNIYEDIITLKNNEHSFDNIPHFLFFGSSGSGKNTLINFLLENIYDKRIYNKKKVAYSVSGYSNSNVIYEVEQSDFHLTIEPSNSGFDKYLIQEIVKEYAQQKLINVYGIKRNFKVILVKNIDNMSFFAQTALRRMMEKYSHVCKFILCGYQLSKIIEPIRSRCLEIRVPAPTNDEIFKTIFKIAIKEKKLLRLDDFNDIVINCDRNIKKAIWLLECIIHKINPHFNWKDKLMIITNYMLNVRKIKVISGKHIEHIRQLLYDIFITNISGTKVITEMMTQLINGLNSNESNIDNDLLKHKILEIVSHFEYNLSRGKRTVIHLEAFINNIMLLIYDFNP